MKLLKWLFPALLLTGLVAVFFAWQSQTAPDMDTTVQIKTETSISIVTPTLFVQDNDGQVSPIQIKQNETIIEHARSLIQIANQIYGTAGWWHSSYQVYYIPSDPESSKSPSDLPMPTEWKEDHWDLVDENGLIIQAVSIQDSGDPATSQVGFYKDGVETNLLYGMTWEEEPQPVSVGNGFLNQLAADKSMVILEEKDEILGNQAVVVLTLRPISAPMIIVGGQLVDANTVENPPIGSYSKFYFSKDTGLLMLYEAYNLLEDGQEQLMHRIISLAYEKVNDLPAEVAKYLQ